MTSRRPLRVLALPAATLLLAAACTAPDAGPGATSSPGTLSGTLTVLAAASLTEAFTRLGDELTAQHPDVEVVLSFGPSSGLAQQVLTGAPADVLATADPATMQTVVDAGEVAGDTEVFARNSLQIAVPPDDPGRVQGLADLADPARTVALCAPQVPCGAAAERVFRAAGLTPAPDTLERDVRAALSKVRLGEVDAALVYRTDVAAAGAEVQGIDFPEAAGAANDYPLAVLAGAPNPAAGEAFVELVRSAEGQQVLTDAGFARP
ncbi:molybdate ABC transporter substrate-binding protein [Auraticoccus monumenti]|uniref:Molybdate transport system substrate-binding protein n=1 Tax=Auraticoccus monumenti TaxID=675864 RepID=A0A1G6X1J3_9ACTN|nr:molybdate ABC transporter substrate-binding protein [Auraticoccus monumenti]SDD71904.1 molybdate transport system substrate-binding protein [Auraticoccus monumenti]